MSKDPPAVGYQTEGLDNQGRNNRDLFLGRAGSFRLLALQSGLIATGEKQKQLQQQGC